MRNTEISTTDYEVTQVKPDDIDRELSDFFIESAIHLNKIYGNKYPHWDQFRLRTYAENYRIVIVRYKGQLCGVMASRLMVSILDEMTKILYQDILFATKPKATLLLLKDFLTFGKSNADHIITSVGTATNLKAKSLEKLGFKELETLYRLEVEK